MFEVYDENGERVLPEGFGNPAGRRPGKCKKVKNKQSLDSEGKPRRGRPPMNPANRKAKPKAKVGRPKMNFTPEPVSPDFNYHGNDEYQPWMCQKIIEVAMGGGFQAAMMLACGIKSTTTLYNWMDRHKEFADAYDFAKTCSKAYLEKIAVDAATGRIEKCNPTALALLMNAKFPEEYRRTGDSGNTQITVNTVNLTAGQMDTQIAQKMEKLAALGISWEGLMPSNNNNKDVVDAEYVANDGEDL